MYGQIIAAVIGLVAVRAWTRHTYSGMWTRYYTGRLMSILGVIIIIAVMLPMRLLPKRRRFTDYHHDNFYPYDEPDTVYYQD